MKPVSIEFVENQSWRFVWSVAATFVFGVAGALAWHAWKTEQSSAQVRARMEELQNRLHQTSQAVPVAADPRHASAMRAAKLLQQDPNKPFAAIENLDETGARLLTMSLDSASDALRLEYELASVEQASAVSAALNAGYERAPWRLESVNAVTKGTAMGVVGPTQAVKGIWSAQLSAL
jgi:predicted negative regulator of RcsB-dependent stress response